jgi:hypothetical protein
MIDSEIEAEDDPTKKAIPTPSRTDAWAAYPSSTAPGAGQISGRGHDLV